MTDAELFERMGPEDDPFEPEECQPEYPILPEDCEHENIDRRMDKDGGFYTVCLDCGEEW